METVPRPMAHSSREKMAQINREFTGGDSAYPAWRELFRGLRERDGGDGPPWRLRALLSPAGGKGLPRHAGDRHIDTPVSDTSTCAPRRR